MAGWLLLLLQAAHTAPPPPLAGFDLRDLRPQPGSACAPGQAGRSDDIIVCGVRDQAPLPEGPSFAIDPMVPRAEIGVGNARLSVDAEQAELPLGQVSRRALVRLRVPF